MTRRVLRTQESGACERVRELVGPGWRRQDV
jgi:hypothetical protein